MSRNVLTSSIAPRVLRRLIAFDFDYTVVAQNTDTVIRSLLPDNEYPEESLIDTAGWTEYMAEIFRRLQHRKVTPEHICQQIRYIPEVPGFVRLLKQLHQHKSLYDLIIISDSNSVFIEEWLQAHKLANCFAGVYTNPARFEIDTGLLTIQPYHHQTECKMSAANLCKGKVLEHFVTEQNLRYNIEYERVVYVGDGSNDLCPVLKLRVGDFACARIGFALAKKLNKERDKMQLRANVLLWKNGFDLAAMLSDVLKLEEANEEGQTQTSQTNAEEQKKEDEVKQQQQEQTAQQADSEAEKAKQ